MIPMPFFIEGIGGMKVEGTTEFPGTTICFHGGPGGNSLSLYPFFPAERLLGDWYFADVPNHGRSEGTGGDWSREACIAMLEGFADRLEGPLRVSGLSWGANVALEWAHAHSERFQCLITMSGAGNLDAVERHQMGVMANISPRLVAMMERGEVAEGKEAEYLSNRIWIETLPIWLEGNPCMEHYREKTLEFTPNSAANKGYWEHWLKPYLKPDLVRGQLMDLHERGVPAFVSWGKDDRMGDETCAMGYYAEGTGAELLLMENAGHCLFADHPDLFFDALNDFMMRL